jgi:hypothetical protein
MTATLIAAGGVAALVILGAYLRWAVKPVTASFRLGNAMSREQRASQKRQINLLIRTLGYAVGDGDAGLLERDRPGRSAWYDRARPAAVLVTLLRPARAVRKLRSSDDAVAWMLDAVLAQERKHREADQFAVSSK